jgi:hypothetical protein
MSKKGTLSVPALGVAAAALLGVAAFLQPRIDEIREQPAITPPNVTKVMSGLKGAALPFEYTLGAISGFRQIIAGLLWVRSDSMFHSGNYDGILPLIRMITWLDPNWLDPYATGAWHLTYNFTDTDQRSDRRYLPPGVALLNEGIANNPDIFDMYKEKGWLYFDKFKDYEKSAATYAEGMKHNPDITQVGHALAHAYERDGNLAKAQETWEFCIREHERILKESEAIIAGTNPNGSKASKDDIGRAQDKLGRATQGVKNARKNLEILKVRIAARERERSLKKPLDVNFTYRITRVKPKVLEIAGTWNLIGANSFNYPADPNDPAQLAKAGIAVEGPVEGARVEARLFDAGYKLSSEEENKEFSFEVDPSVTYMQDILSTRGGRQVKKGEIYLKTGLNGTVTDQFAKNAGISPFALKQADGLGLPLDQALKSNTYLSPFGQQQLASIADPIRYGNIQPIRTSAEAGPIIAKLKTDAGVIAKLTKAGYSVAVKDMYLPGEFKREVNMAQDPKMYSFSKPEYELVLTINPAHTPDFVRDRIGWRGEGWTDKRFLDTKTFPGRNVIRVVIKLKKEDITGEGRKLLAESDPGLKLPSEQYK